MHKIILLVVILSILCCAAHGRRDSERGVCPSNGNAHAVYVTTNMGGNIESFDTFGKYLGNVLNTSSLPTGVTLQKLRGIVEGPDGLLYVAASRSSFSRIFALSPFGLPQLRKRAPEPNMPFKDERVADNEMAIHSLPPSLRMNDDCTRNYVYTLTKISSQNPNLNHPYAFVFHPDDGTLLVTNQNSVTVTRYVGPTTTKEQVMDYFARASRNIKKSSKLEASLAALLQKVVPLEGSDPMPFSGGVSGYAGMPLPPSWSILHALRLARTNASNHSPAEMSENTLSATSTIPLKATGVFAGGFSPFYNMLSVRGLAISPKMKYSIDDRLFVHEMYSTLRNSPSRAINHPIDMAGKTVIDLRVILVADVVSNSIHVLNEHTGELLWTYTNIVRQPIQIHFPQSAKTTTTTGDIWFYVTSKDGGVYKLHLRRPTTVTSRKGASVLVPPGHPMKAVSGFYENELHNTIYIADRVGRAIYTYGTPDRATDPKEIHYTGIFSHHMVDYPEHILLTLVESQRNIPFCYELSQTGRLRFTALCMAAQIWILLTVLIAVILICCRTQIGWLVCSSCCGLSQNSSKEPSEV